MLVKLKDYERIYQIIASIVKSEGVDPAHACTFFSVFGSHLLTSHYKIEAIPRCGLAAFYVGGQHEVLCFGNLTERGVSAQGENFHCWIEAGDWLIDFMAPEFPKLFKTEFNITPKMFQKRKTDMVSDVNNMAKEGDFFFAQHPELAVQRLSQFWEKPVYGDLAEICTAWFKKYPKSISPNCITSNGKGSYTDVKLSGVSVKSRW